MKSEVYRQKVNTREELVARIMNSAAVIKQERQDDLRRATRTKKKMKSNFVGRERYRKNRAQFTAHRFLESPGFYSAVEYIATNYN